MQGDYRYPIIATAAGGAIEMYDFSIFLFLSDYLSAVFLPLAKQGDYLAAGLMVTGYIDWLYRAPPGGHHVWLFWGLSGP